MDNTKLIEFVNSKMDKIHKNLGSVLEQSIDVGEVFIKLKDECESFADWFIDNPECSVKQTQAYKLMRIAVHKHQARLSFNDNTATTINDLQKVLPKVNEPPMLIEANPAHLGYVGTKPGGETKNDWYTPSIYIEAARIVMGTIDFDPFSSVAANENFVRASDFLTVDDDALDENMSWCEDGTPHKTLWMNPPYSKGMAGKAVAKFTTEWKNCSFLEAIVLMNASTDTQWWDELMNWCSAVCFTKGRISFETTDGKKSSGNTKGQCFFYFGDNVEEFKKQFSEFGNVLRRL